MKLSSFFRTISLAIVAVGGVTVLAGKSADGKRRVAQASADPNPAINAPDQFAWRAFSDINKPANNQSNDALWETWATDQDTFPTSPDPKNRPQWPGPKKRPMDLVASTQFRLLNRIRGKTLPKILPDGGQEEVRRNRPAFDYIVGHDLWHLDGLITAYKSATPVDLPIDSIEIKAQWVPIDATKKPRYHWNTDKSGKLFGLVALHISTKALRNWFWATFEHMDNPNRGKDLGYHDSFGIVPPNTKDGKPSQGLRDLFASAGLGPEWLNYRLAGTQVDFIDSTGRFTRMGNSVIENGLVAKSSCINCHAMARVDGTAVGGFDFIVGIPDQGMFFFSDGSRKSLQLDFVWGFAAAQPIPKKPKP